MFNLNWSVVLVFFIGVPLSWFTIITGGEHLWPHISHLIGL